SILMENLASNQEEECRLFGRKLGRSSRGAGRHYVRIESTFTICRLWAVCLVVLALAIACGDSERKHVNRLLGSWKRQQTTLCSFSYPTDLEFFEDNKYVTTGISQWTGGSYRLIGERIRIDTA